MIDRTAWMLPFSMKKSPELICPTCAKGLLHIKKESFYKEEPLHSKMGRDHDEWEPDWVSYVYSCLFVCTNDRCKEIVSSSGIGRVSGFTWYDEENDEMVEDYAETFSPKFFEPCLMPFDIPTKCPKSVYEPLCESFRLFFCSPSAAANNVRIAIEELLTALNVKRFNIVKGKRKFIILHRRIDLLPQKYANLKELILAIKWLGNAGSHGNSGGQGIITPDDVMDSYELTEHILQEIYAPKAKKLKALAKRVNKNKGPAK